MHTISNFSLGSELCHPWTLTLHMAVYFNSVESLRQHLEALDCSIVFGVDQEWICGQLVTPSEQRKKVVEWLLCRIEPKILANTNTSVRFDNEKYSKELLTLMSSLGFCSSDRIDLIKGTASKRDQLQFSLLLELSETCNGENDPSNLDKDYEQGNQFIQEIVSHPTVIKGLFSPKVDLLPGDVAALIMKSQHKTLENISRNQVTELIEKLKDATEKLVQELNDKLEELTVIKDKHLYNLYTCEEVTGTCRSLDTMVTSMNARLEHFHSCYDNKLAAWCRMSDTLPTQLNVTLARLSAFRTMLQMFDSVQTTANRLEEMDIARTDDHHTTLKTASDRFFLNQDFLLGTSWSLVPIFNEPS